MPSPSLFLLLLFLLLSVQCTLGSGDGLSSGDPLQHVSPGHLSSFENAVSRCLWTDAALIARESKDALDLMNRFALLERQLKERLSSLKGVIDSLKPMPTIVPALQWAQSPTHIFLNIKFAHIISAPATLNVEVTNASFSEGSMFLEATDGRKLFRLELDFFDTIDASQSTWQLASVGRMTVNIKKESDAPSRWGKLVSKKSKGQVSLWYAMHEQHAKELEKLKEVDKDDEGQGMLKKKDKDSDKEKEKAKAEEAEEQSAGPSSDAETSEGTIVSPGETEAREKRTARKNELASSIAELERRAKQRKRDLDFEVVEKKKEVDRETEEKISTLRARYKKEETPKSNEAGKSSEL